MANQASLPQTSQPSMQMNVPMSMPSTIAMQPLGIQPYNPLTSPIGLSPRMPYSSGQPSAFTSIASFTQQSVVPQPAMSNHGNSLMGIHSFPVSPYDTLSPPPPQPSQSPAPSMLSGIASKSQLPPTPTANGMMGMGNQPLSPNAPGNHIRRPSIQTNHSPYGAIGKPRGTSSSIIGDEEYSRASPPSPDGRPLGSSALVDENDTIVQLPKRRGTANNVPTPVEPIGSRWGGRGGAVPGGWPGAPWSPPGPAAVARPSLNRIGSPFMPSS